MHSLAAPQAAALAWTSDGLQAPLGPFAAVRFPVSLLDQHPHCVTWVFMGGLPSTEGIQIFEPSLVSKS